MKTKQRYMLANDMRRKPLIEGEVVSKRQSQVFSAIIVVSADTTSATAGTRNMILARGKKIT